jgi:hypothetical protein
MKWHGFEAVEAEIRREKAEALGRTGERLERILHEMETCRRDLMHPTTGRRDLHGAARASAERREKLAEHDRLWEQARYLRHCLIVQREAMGLWRHDDVDRQYPLPEPLTVPVAART